MNADALARNDASGMALHHAGGRQNAPLFRLS
jgi:hypothetical protein